MNKKLFCKPGPGHTLPLYKSNLGEENLSFRPIDIANDLDLIHSWVNQPYARRYWQQAGPISVLEEYYQYILVNPFAHSFIGLSNDNVVAQIDCYHITQEELSNHVENTPGSCGLHILMLPPRQNRKGLTESVLKAFVDFYFSFGEAEVLYGEPDINNTAANAAALLAGFTYQRTIELAEKTANLYAFTREQYFTPTLTPTI